MSSYRLTPQAQTGLSSILEDVEARFGVDVAIEVLERIGGGLELIADTPQIGHRREDITPLEHVLFWHVGPTLIAYQVGESGVEILFVERGERDWAGLTKAGGSGARDFPQRVYHILLPYPVYLSDIPSRG